MNLVVLVAAVCLAAGVGLVRREVRRRHLERWIIPWLLRSWRLGRWRPEPDDEIHLILAIADHFEPRSEGASAEVALARVEYWLREYPRMLGAFRDADNRPPQHTFFFPIEEYDPEQLDALTTLCRQGYGEVEVHLHHDGDTAEGLQETLRDALQIFSERHGLLSRHRETGALAYGFVHGNWALNNARDDGRWCGVNDEIRVLRETGCYADFTFPSAPSCTQPPTVNSLYYAASVPERSRGHDHGVRVGEGPAPVGSLLMIQGPLLVHARRVREAMIPRPGVENGCLQASQPATIERLNLWLRARVRVPTRPDWYFVKLHAHGATERDRDVLLGAPMLLFHEALARRATLDPRFHVHYVTAREMYNLVRAAETGWRGSVAEARDFELVRNTSRAEMTAGSALGGTH
ncbi:MAG: hypothetical protein NVSMB9_25490 [Isosphaeraceae bacterium]